LFLTRRNKKEQLFLTHRNNQAVLASARKATKCGVLLLSAMALAAAGCASSSGDSSTPGQTSDAPASNQTSQSGADQAGGSNSGSYLTLADYEANKDAYASTDVVLFFSAVWCSTCKVARDNIESDLSAIPSDLTIVVVDFDSANELRRKHGVTVQHTFVQVDPAGNELAKWAGSVTVEDIAKNTV
jgi:thiol:disulfide interchange protein